MARKKIECTTLNSWQEVDLCLQQIGSIDRDLAIIEATMNEQIDKAKAEAQKASEPLQGKKTGLELAIKQYCETNKDEFAKVKTKTLQFGEVGFRQSSKIMIKKVAETLKKLKEKALFSCIRTKEEPDKEAMKNLTDKTLAFVGANRKVEDVFGYTVNQEKLKDAA